MSSFADNPIIEREPVVSHEGYLSLPSGTYLCTLRVQHGTPTRRKIVIAEEDYQTDGVPYRCFIHFPLAP